MKKKEEVTTLSYLPEKKPVKILITSGASCPDAMVEEVIKKITGYFNCSKSIDDLINELVNIRDNSTQSVQINSI